jgi:hypothetical protein
MGGEKCGLMPGQRRQWKKANDFYFEHSLLVARI